MQENLRTPRPTPKNGNKTAVERKLLLTKTWDDANTSENVTTKRVFSLPPHNLTAREKSIFTEKTLRCTLIQVLKVNH